MMENIWIRRLFIAQGTMTLVLGIAGIFLPLLPTTPFLLLSAYFYGKSSEKFYNMLLNNKYVGKYIKDFRAGKGISLKSKIVSIASLWLTMTVSIIFIIDVLFVKIVLVTISTAVSYYLLSLNTLEE